MASVVPPKKNTAFVFYTGLISQADTTAFQSSPTLAAGDVKVQTDDGALANITTLPTAAGKRVKVSLSATEMNGDNVTVIFSDAAGAEWCDRIVNIQTAQNTIDDEAAAILANSNTLTDASGNILSTQTTVNTIVSMVEKMLQASGNP